ncbi:hypothetical protein [Lysinibacillus fusiformis]|uniref:hypothetical protein n=1 Tax=Lysinibacillus fusiformis TaxID=28031 RepID=UPI0011727DF0|nr:hypothetical protein [Lysinibacillus fusiformis]MED4888564.1 hypothetical protein [Lysinibacillus fusiformis]
MESVRTIKDRISKDRHPKPQTDFIRKVSDIFTNDTDKKEGLINIINKQNSVTK